MKKSRKAKIQICSVFADCPECGEELIDTQSGSHVIQIGHYNKNEKFECSGCHKKFKLEIKAWK